MYPKKIPYYLCMSIFCLHAHFSSAQNENLDIFASEDPLKITLEFDQKQLLKGKYKGAYMPAQFHIELADSAAVSTPIRIRARGNSRRKYCLLPPIKLNFKDPESDQSRFMGLSTLKLVTPCKNNETFQQYVYTEYLAYRMFNQISPISFKVRLVDLTYIDSKGKKDPYHAYGFLIEHVDHMAARNTSREVEVPKFSQKLVDMGYMAKVAVFQFAIGNTDWLVENLHNVKLIQLNTFSKQEIYAVPYDFDYSGLVNTIYAVPHEDLGLTSVQERLYRGLCFSKEELESVFQLFRERKTEIFALIDNFDMLEDSHRNAVGKYIEEFYQIIDNPVFVRNQIQGYCIK